MRKIFIAALAGTMPLAAAPAFAQDSSDTPFSGIYVGASGGYDIQKNDVGASILFDRNLDGGFRDTVTTPTGANAFSTGFCNGSARTQLSPAAGGSCRNDRDGWSYYGRVGVDHQSGPIVYGAVGEFGRSEITDSVTGFSTTPASYVMTRSVDWEASIRGRAGFAANKTLFYGTFGAAYAKIDSSFATTNTANAFATSGKNRQWGFIGGGGIEQKLTPNISIGLEYLYHEYQDNDFRVRATAGAGIAGSPVLLAANPFVLAPNTRGTDFRRSDPQFSWNSLRATVAFRF
ncbi:outer membrane protein [Sphingomonas sp.]|uniref:outer membrane protein n=1 Tax=Sphingomonas sp. TaxID=28214 RepID=UPI0035BBA2D3